MHIQIFIHFSLQPLPFHYVSETLYLPNICLHVYVTDSLLFWMVVIYNIIIIILVV